MRILGVDYGDARTGIAVSDALGMMAQGVETVHSRQAEKVAEKVAVYAAQYQVNLIVVGLPKNMNNSIGQRGEATLAFTELLKEKTDCEIVLWDERLSTVSAIRVLNETNTRGKKRKNVVDTVAAEIILQNYLDYQSRKGESI